MDINKQRYVIIVPDGMGDYPIAELGNKTIIQKAETPNMDSLGSNGMVGTVRTIPEGLPAASDVANLSIIGFNPEKYYTGRAPLEAANIGVALDEWDVAYRCNLVTLADGRMQDFSAGHISTPEATEIIRYLDIELGIQGVLRFYPGISYRHLMVWSKGESRAECTPPHDITGQEYAPYLPKGPGADFLTSLMKESQRILPRSPVNAERTRAGKPAATSIWLWGQGFRPKFPTFKERYHLNGALISAVDLLKGIGIYLGLEVIDVPGATGYIDTNYSGKAEYALSALANKDLVFIHIEAPDEAGHNGDIKAKLKAVEDIDRLVIGRVRDGLKKYPNHRIMVMPDHLTPISVRTHTREPVPFLIYDSKRVLSPVAAPPCFDEETALGTGITFPDGEALMKFFLSGGSDRL